MAAEEVGDIVSLLSTDERNFLIRNNGDKVAIGSLEGKMIALYFSISWSPRCKRFTLRLIEVYNELTSRDNNFEIIFLPYDCCKSCNSCEKSFIEYFSKIPWFTVPFSDDKIKKKLHELFQVSRRPTLVILDTDGKVLNREGVQAIRGYGTEAYPFTVEKISKLREEVENAKKDQTLRSILVSSSRDYLITNDRSKVSVSSLQGKIVALYFSCNRDCCSEFSPILAQIYKKLKEIGEGFEVVLVSLEDDESYYDEAIENMPWLAFPFNDKSCDKLFGYFGLQEYKCSTVILIGSDGKTMNVDLIELIKEYEFEAWEAFPFSQEKLYELSEKVKARLESHTLESLLVSDDLDYVIGKNGLKVPVKELVGKTILLQFSARWGRAFLTKVIKEYHKIKNVDTDFEVIYIPSEDYESLFDECFSLIPWLALPLYDERVEFLNRRFKIHGIPSLVAIGPTGGTINKDVEKLLMTHGADAYPFTEEKLKELEHQNKEMPERWPKKIAYHIHKHELLLIRCCSDYRCGVCEESGDSWSYCCIKCDFDLHPKCALW
ncbi:probable nucleoredoxin 1-2 isoform X2 [Zingiber officinale]|nr:probable nucleoredoxin 1-2 isoform X2 [Zingiber officinale]